MYTITALRVDVKIIEYRLLITALLDTFPNGTMFYDITFQCKLEVSGCDKCKMHNYIQQRNESVYPFSCHQLNTGPCVAKRS
jgi:hypothetical protein